jgi:HSP20 family protein
MNSLNPNPTKGIETIMSTTLSVDPLHGLRLFEDAMTRIMSEPRASRPWSPAVDILETEDALIVKADLPNVKIEDLDIRVENQTLTISGARKFEKEENVKGYHRIERSYGEFVRSFAVPSTVDTEKVAANYKDGVLTITLPRKESAKPKQVKVNVTDGATQ